MKNLKNILVATDFSEYSDSAMEEAALLAGKFNANLYVMHVVNRIQECVPDYCLTDAQVAGGKISLIEEATRKLAEKIAIIKERFNISAIPEIRYGNAYEEIINDEREKEIDLVVMSPHKRNNFSDKFFTHLSDRIVKGSVSDTLLMSQNV